MTDLDLHLNKLIIALDGINLDQRIFIVEQYRDKVAAFKVNHASYTFMPAYTNKLMYDFKLSDIPNTNETVIEHILKTDASLVTVMMNNSESAYAKLAPLADRIRLVGVTALTSMSEAEYMDIYGRSLEEAYERSIRLMEKYKFFGAVCAPTDLKYFEQSPLKTLCPGIRLEGDDLGDQVRTMTPTEAIKEGADYIIMGRSFINRITFKGVDA